MAVVAKFYVSETTRFGQQPHPNLDSHQQTNVTLKPVFGTDDHPNAEWSKFTPDGLIQMTITNPDAEDYFVPGEEYIVRFTKCQPQKSRG